MQHINDEYLREVERILSKTQSGPWRSFIEGRDHTSGSNFIMTGDGESRGNDIELIGATQDDQDFIALAHEIVPLLVAEIRRLNLSPNKAEQR